jgi:hypothetical protein
VEQSQEVVRLLLIANQQFPEPIQPGVCSFDFPPPGGLLAPPNRRGLLSDLPYMSHITARPDDRSGGFAAVALVRAQMLLFHSGGLGAADDDAVQCFRQ